MLKKLLSAMALGCIALCANAQELEQTFPNQNAYHGIIPQVVTSNRTSQFWISTEDDEYISSKPCWNDFTIYDSNMEQIINVVPPKGIIPIGYFNSNMDGYCMPASQKYLMMTTNMNTLHRRL